MVDITFIKNPKFLANKKNISVNLKSQFFLKRHKLYLNNILLKR